MWRREVGVAGANTQSIRKDKPACSLPLSGVILWSIVLFFGLGYRFAILKAQTPARAGNPALGAQLRRAITIAEQGDKGKALALTQQLLEQNPKFEPALKFQGALFEDLGHEPEAAASYQAALKLAPSDPELLLKVGVYQLEAGDNDEAIRLFARCLKLLPHDGDALYYLAQAYHLKGDNELALKTIRECLRVDPSNASVWQKYGELLCSSGDNEAALHWLLKAQSADPRLDRIDFDLGVASYKNMDLENALQYSTKAVERRPNDLNMLALLAAIDVKLGKWEDAEPEFRAILLGKSEDIPSLLGLGHCELELKKYQEAADALERVLQQDPTQILAHFYLSRAYMALGRTADAQYEADLHSKMLEQVSSSQFEGDTEREKSIWGQARQMLAESKESEALQLFRDESTGPFATPGGPYVLVGTLYLFMDRPSDADRCLRQALLVEPTVRGAHTSMGMLALQQDDLDKAENEFKTELAHDANNHAAAAELGEVRYRQRRWSDAADLLSKSGTMVPSLLYMLCDSYFHMGNVKEADLTAELIVAYSKNQPEVMQGVIDLLNRNQQMVLAQRLLGKAHS